MKCSIPYLRPMIQRDRSKMEDVLILRSASHKQTVKNRTQQWSREKWPKEGGQDLLIWHSLEVSSIHEWGSLRTNNLNRKPSPHMHQIASNIIDYKLITLRALMPPLYWILRNLWLSGFIESILEKWGMETIGYRRIWDLRFSMLWLTKVMGWQSFPIKVKTIWWLFVNLHLYLKCNIYSSRVNKCALKDQVENI